MTKIEGLIAKICQDSSHFADQDFNESGIRRIMEEYADYRLELFRDEIVKIAKRQFDFLSENNLLQPGIEPIGWFAEVQQIKLPEHD